MADPSSVERIKAASAQLRGSIAADLASPEPKFSAENIQLLKFHGIYQQEDRDARKSVRDGESERAYSFMLRTKQPGGFVPASFYLALEALADSHANGTLRVTTRQAFQLHGVLKSELKDTIATIGESLGSTLGACGDINHNVVAPAAPFASKRYQVARDAARAIADLLTPQTGAYFEIWQDGESVYASEPEVEPIYGATYLPRKFKIAVAAPGDNSVDIYTNDVGVVPVLGENDDVLLGYDLIVGGGLGMTHRKVATYPRLGDHLGFVTIEQLLPAVRAIVEVQRDFGDRTNRKHARLKYTIADRGLAWFKAEVERYAGFAFGAWRELPPWTELDYLGWSEQGDGRLFVGISVANGRIKDDDTMRLKTALREIVSRYDLDLVLTPQQNVLIIGISRAARADVDAILSEHGVRPVERVGAIERRALACPALPTCGLALAESERVSPDLVAAIQAKLDARGLGAEPISLRMTGCPNGCARPYMAEIGLVGSSLGKYSVYLGADANSTRLNTLYRELVPYDEIVPLLDGLFASFAAERHAGEGFGDYCARAVVAKREPVAAG